MKGLGVPGFVISFFDSSKDFVTIPYSPQGDMIKSAAIEVKFPSHSTTPEEHRKEIEEIQLELSKIGNGKIVATRVISIPEEIDVAAAFTKLCHKCPDAFVFAFSTPLTGCWLGASPELLMESNGNNVLRTMALAGTRPFGTPGKWDDKNIEEQKMVTDFIEECLSENGFDVTLGETFSKPAGIIEHLCTPVSAHSDEKIDPSRLSSLLKSLSPTPALSGLPKDLAFKVISSTENFSRGCYGGFCGPYRNPSDFCFFVTLRCAMVHADRFAIFAGGGITLKSDPSDEWNETELKSAFLKNLSKIK